MNLFGIALRKPDFNELTAAAVMAAGLWVLAIGSCSLLKLELSAADAGALLIVTAWGCASVRFGIRIDRGQRHVAANATVSAALLLVYQGALALV